MLLASAAGCTILEYAFVFVFVFILFSHGKLDVPIRDGVRVTTYDITFTKVCLRFVKPYSQFQRKRSCSMHRTGFIRGSTSLLMFTNRILAKLLAKLYLEWEGTRSYEPYHARPIPGEGDLNYR